MSAEKLKKNAQTFTMTAYSPMPIRRGLNYCPGGHDSVKICKRGCLIIVLWVGFIKSRKMGWIIKGGKILSLRSKDIFIHYATYKQRNTS